MDLSEVEYVLGKKHNINIVFILRNQATYSVPIMLFVHHYINYGGESPDMTIDDDCGEIFSNKKVIEISKKFWDIKFLESYIKKHCLSDVILKSRYLTRNPEYYYDHKFMIISPYCGTTSWEEVLFRAINSIHIPSYIVYTYSSGVGWKLPTYLIIKNAVKKRKNEWYFDGEMDASRIFEIVDFYAEDYDEIINFASSEMKFDDFKRFKEGVKTKLKYSTGGWGNTDNFEVIEGF